MGLYKGVCWVMLLALLTFIFVALSAQGNKRAMSRLTELKRQGAGAKGRAAMARPTRQEAQDEGCIIS
jgi:uncharacterized protein